MRSFSLAGDISCAFPRQSAIGSRRMIGTAYVQGLQSDDLRHGVAATGKHFLGYALSEGGRNWGPVQCGPRELREVYAEPFATISLIKLIVSG